MKKIRIKELTAAIAGIAIFLGLISCQNPFFPHYSEKDILGAITGNAPIGPLSVLPSGNGIWARTATSCANDWFYTVSADNNGNTIVAGFLWGYLYDAAPSIFGGITLQRLCSHANPALVKYDASGHVLWAKTVESISIDPLSGLSRADFMAAAFDSAGNIYAVGSQSGNVTMNYGNGVTITTDQSSYNIPIIVKYDAGGNAVWAKNLLSGPAKTANFNAVAVSPDGSVYAIGSYAGDGPFCFGDTPSTEVSGSSSLSNPVLVKYDSNGVAQWAVSTVAGINSSVFDSIAVDGDGNIFVSGYQNGNDYTYGSAGGGGVSINNTNPGTVANPILLKYSPNGSALWARSREGAGNINAVRFLSVSVDRDGNAFVASSVDGKDASNYGNGVTVTGIMSRRNPFLLKYSPNGDALWGRTLTEGSFEDHDMYFWQWSEAGFSAVAAAPDGSVYVTGGINSLGAYDFGLGPLSIDRKPIEYISPIIVKYSPSGDPIFSKVAVVEGPAIYECQAYFNSAVVDNSGNLYAAGYQISNEPYYYGDIGNPETTAKGPCTSQNPVLVKFQ